MATYAIGDVQGCYRSLRKLLKKIHFTPGDDQLWFTGDLVNRGPDSLSVLRLVKELGQSAVTVLGNHDLHLLAIAAGKRALKKSDTVADVLDAPDCDDLLAWLRARPLFHYDQRYQVALVHAGLQPDWTVEQAAAHAAEVEAVLRDNDRYRWLLKRMYGNQPAAWTDELSGAERLRAIVNTFTRMRYCHPDGRMAFDCYSAPGAQPSSLLPWYSLRTVRRRVRVVFGHWSTLGAGIHGDAVSLDSGCVWGGKLTAFRVDKETENALFVRVKCAG